MKKKPISSTSPSFEGYIDSWIDHDVYTVGLTEPPRVMTFTIAICGLFLEVAASVSV